LVSEKWDHKSQKEESKKKFSDKERKVRKKALYDNDYGQVK